MRLAARGLRDLDSGPEKISDDAEAQALKRQAQKVYLESFALAGALTAIVALLPF